jgi:hypothetical protein
VVFVLAVAPKSVIVEAPESTEEIRTGLTKGPVLDDCTTIPAEIPAVDDTPVITALPEDVLPVIEIGAPASRLVTVPFAVSGVRFWFL